MTNEITGVVLSSSSITANVEDSISLSTDVQVGHTHTNKLLLDSITEIVSDKFYVFEQNIASKEWNVEHNLNKYPSITVVDSAGSVVVGDVIYTSLNSVHIFFIGEFVGKAYFN